MTVFRWALITCEFAPLWRVLIQLQEMQPVDVFFTFDSVFAGSFYPYISGLLQKP